MATANKQTTPKKRATFHIDESILNDFYNAAYWSRLSHTDGATAAFTQFVDTWKEAKENKQYLTGGKIKQRPDGETIAPDTGGTYLMKSNK